MSTEPVQPDLAPIEISPDAVREISSRVRDWTGWPRAVVKFGPTSNEAISPVAICDPETHTIEVDPEYVVLNPNRVLLTVTPFRLRQEAVLTGTLLHEAGHARHSRWLTPDLTHSDGKPVSKQALALARLCEEARVEGLMARDADTIGATGLGWTMRAMAAYLLPPTKMSMDPAQAMMDVLSSWVLRAGRQVALASHMTGPVRYDMPGWVNQFTSLLHLAIVNHLVTLPMPAVDAVDPEVTAISVVRLIRTMITSGDDTGTTMVDVARDVLELLFPETPPEEQPSVSGGCGAGQEPEEGAEDGDDGAEPQSEAGEPGDGPSEAEDEEPEAEDGAEGEPEDGEDGDESASASSEEQAADEAAADRAQQVAEALAALESESKAQVSGEATDEAEQAPPLEPGTGAGAGPGGSLGGSWREPSSEQRDVQKGAERFLRDMIDASESSTRLLSDQPSAVIDGVALTAWKAGGQSREPRFFVRNKRTVEPSPPIKIAILVDVSSSMDSLQEPSAVLSWSLASAALDLRNFAGRGQQIESCLIHWGDTVRTIQEPGVVLPGIRTAACVQGTSNMHGALAEVERLMPGFFDIGEAPVNRLLVQFTDWKLFEETAAESTTWIGRALEAGVNMLSVVPGSYSARYARLNDMLQAIPIQRGASNLVKYNPERPGEVWTKAAEMLGGPGLRPGEIPAPFEGF